MSEYTAEREFDLPADTLWSVVSDFADLSWLPGKPVCSSQGEGPGMVRTLTMPPIPEIRERLEAIDEESRTIVYSVIEGNPMPVAEYHPTMRVLDAGEGRSRLVWSSTWEPDGVSEEEAARSVAEMYTNVLAAMKTKLERIHVN